MLLRSVLILSGITLVIYGQDSFRIRGQRPDCTLVDCGVPTGCAFEDTFIPKGQCCPVCRRDHGPDCRLVRCGAPPGCAIEDTFIPRGQCCPICRRRFDKPGRCPNVGSNFGICVSLCTGDADCPGRDKCCSNGCGHLCSRPVFGDWWPRCFNVICPMLRCPYGLYTPPGQCCSVCRPPPPDEFTNCAAVLCLQAPCSRPITPPGQCCPVCPKGGDDN